MADAMYVAATGMRAHQTEVDAISNNIANLNTVGYRGETVSFSALTSAMAAEVGELDSPAGVLAPPSGGTIGRLGLSTGGGGPSARACISPRPTPASRSWPSPERMDWARSSRVTLSSRTWSLLIKWSLS